MDIYVDIYDMNVDIYMYIWICMYVIFAGFIFINYLLPTGM